MKAVAVSVVTRLSPRASRVDLFGLASLQPYPRGDCSDASPPISSTRSTPSSVRSPRRCAGRCGCSPVPAPARPGRSPTGSPTAWPPASTSPPRCSRSRSPPGPPARCAPGCASWAPPGVQARTFHSAALRQLRYFWPQVYGADLPTLTESKLPLLALAARRQRARRRPGASCATSPPRSSGPRSATSAPRTTPRLAPGRGRDGLRPGRRDAWRGSSPPTRTSSATRAGWTWRTCCSSPPRCWPRTSGSPPRSAGSTSGSSSTSSRTSRRSRRPCSTSGWAVATRSASSATRPRRSTPSPAPTPPTSATSRASTPAPPRSTWSATTAPPPRSSPPPTRCCPAPPRRA